MDPYLHEWGGLLLRWLHVLAGMAWIGSSFYFMHVDASLKPAPDIPPGKGGEAWEVHGGGFYQVRKWLVAPSSLPPQLIWHKWESYTTWLSGFALLCYLYYGSSDLYLIDPAVMEMSAGMAWLVGIGTLILGWFVYDGLCKSPLAKDDRLLAAVGFLFVILVAYGFQHLFSGRGAMVHTGALMATWMTGNVFLVIIPNQHKVIASLLKGEAPDPALGKAGKIRSTHNNYLTLPVLFLMLANHYPMVWSTPYAYVIVGLVLVAGALIRVFFNLQHQGKGSHWWCWVVAALCIAAAAAVSLTSSPLGREALGLAWRAQPPTEQVVEIVTGRCSMCHTESPVWPGLGIAPKGVVLNTPEAIHRHAPQIALQAVLSNAMPPNNITGMELEERRVLAAWLSTR
jgi:uncharacterized membrane protein